MTRSSKREIERAIDDLAGSDGGGDDPVTVVIRRDLVDGDLNVLETNRKVVEI